MDSGVGKSKRSTSGKFRFSNASVNDLLPESARYYVYDVLQPNLALGVTGKSKTFYRYGRVDGRPQRILIGKFPDVSVEQARKICRAFAGDIASGKNPHRERQRRKGESVFLDLFEHWRQSRIDAGKKEKSINECERILNKNLAKLKNRKLSAIVKADVAKIHTTMRRENGLYIANRALALIRSMYNMADALGFEGVNPTKGIKKFPEESRERYMQRDEVPAFFEALAQENQLFRDYFLLCLLTGARRSNVCGMAWADISLPSATWRIPGAVSKNGRQMVIPLAPKAVDVLQRRHADNQAKDDPIPWVFEGGKKNRNGHLTDPKMAWERIRERSGLKDLRMHDLRRSLASWMAEAGASPLVIGASLGHRSIQSTAVYARIGNEGIVRDSVVSAGEEILLAATAKPAQGVNDAPEGIG